jgi:hypothetical protein
MNNRQSRLLLSVGVVIACVAFAKAQDMPVTLGPPSFPGRQVAVMQSQESGVVVRSGSRQDMGFQFVAAEPAVSNQVVKGAPYSLEATVETDQTLADGNRIVHHQVVRVYRDSEGRTRREETLAAIGPWAASGTPRTLVMIQDPVSGATYSLNPEDKIATKLPRGLPGQVTAFAGPHAGGGAIALSAIPDGPKPLAGVVTGFATTEGGAGAVLVEEGAASPMVKFDDNSESLGKETIAGVSADGVRVTTTIPAEAMGNERAIEITRERWYSSDLQIVLRSKQSDPRFGISSYEVTKLDRSNPAHSLFEVPRDYQIRKAHEPLPPPPAPR